MLATCCCCFAFNWLSANTSACHWIRKIGVRKSCAMALVSALLLRIR
ncbi:Uncharacterised protein [Vibrio cholerae]|nr:Uncharacterised protein [Vibrio cholerae]